MFTINKTNGIGTVKAENETSFTVYFEENGKTLTLLKEFTKTYETLAEAEEALNPEMTEAEAVARLADMEAEKEITRKGVAAQSRLEEMQIEASKKLMRNI